MVARLASLATLALAAVALAAPAHAGGPTMMLGAAEDVVRSPDLVAAKTKMTLLQLAGLDTVRISSFWTPGQVAPSAEEQAILANVDAAARLSGVKVIVQVYHAGSRTTPLTDEARQQFAQYVTALLAAYPGFTDVIVGNEPNLNRFWLPQFNPDRTNAAAPAYLLLLQTVYDAVKAASPSVRVWGGALAPRGADRPGGLRETQSPGAFLRAMGDAYKASGRAAPVMDGLAFHPYADTSDQSPDTPHPLSSTIGLADYDKLVGALGTAFDGTAQPGTTLPILYDEFGVETVIPAAKASLYNGTEPATVRPVDERTQAVYYGKALELAFCQPNVVGLLLFHTEDERALATWQSGIYYADGTPKTSFWSVRDALRRARGGSIRRCPEMALDVRVTDLRTPTRADVKGGSPAVTFTCSLDCAWQLRVLRGVTPVLTLRGYAPYARQVQQFLPARRLTGTLTFEVTASSPVNPGTPTVAVSRPVAYR